MNPIALLIAIPFSLICADWYQLRIEQHFNIKHKELTKSKKDWSLDKFKLYYEDMIK